MGTLKTMLGLALGLAVAAGTGHADEIQGPEFGSSKIASGIADATDEADAEPDLDDYVAVLAAGERLSVTLTAARKSPLLPRIVVIDPDGGERDVDARIVKKGRGVKVPDYSINETGRWALRVFGAEDGVGGYTLKTKVKKAPTLKEKRLEFGGDDLLAVDVPIESVDGAVLTVKLGTKGGGEVVRLLALRGASGADMSDGLSQARLRRGGKKATLKLRLNEGTGTYVLRVGIDSGTGACSLAVSLRAPEERPKGKLSLAESEPYLEALREPQEGAFGTEVVLSGGNFSDELPAVFFGGEPGSARGLRNGGAGLAVLPPPLPVGALVSVRVTNADGQSHCRGSYFRYVEGPAPPPPDPDAVKVRALTPEAARLDAGAEQMFTITLNLRAPPGGAGVTIDPIGGIGTAPALVTVPEGATTADFKFTAGDQSASGRLLATRGSAVFSTVTVQGDDPPPPPPPLDSIDISGWRLQQFNFTWSYTFPANTVVRKGGYVIVARNASQSAFERHWGVSLGSNVTYLDTRDSVPKINGDETFQLDDDGGTAIDGPTAAMPSGAGKNYQRTPGAPAGVLGSWTVASSIASSASPGSGQSASDPPNGVYISEFSDASGGGNFVYEFVEIHFDGTPTSRR